MSKNKFIKRIEQLNKYWANIPNFSVDSIKDKELKPIQLKALINYQYDTDVEKENRSGSEPPSCKSKKECDAKIESHKNLFLSNKDKEALEAIKTQAKERNPNLNDKWTLIQRKENYIENCNTCNSNGVLNCTTCSNCSGLPTGNTKCVTCNGTTKADCISCNGLGKNGDSLCFTCNGKGKKYCHSCKGKGFVQCHSCNGKLKVTCDNCNGKKEVTFTHKINLNIISKTVLSWDNKITPEWLISYFEKETNEIETHVPLIKHSEWHSHTFNLANFEKEQFFASIQGYIKPSEITYNINGKDFNCYYLHDNLVPYELDYIFDEHINKICDNLIEKNEFKYQKQFFQNKIIESVLSEDDSFLIQSKMITDETKEKIKSTFKLFSDTHIEEKGNVDIRDIFKWSSYSFFFIFISMFISGFFIQQSFDWNIISIPHIFSNFSNAIINIPLFFKDYLKETFFFLGTISAGSYLIQKALGSSKGGILRYFGWFFNISLISYLLLFNASPNFHDITFGLNISNYISSLISTLNIWFDILLFSLLFGIFKARNINCFKLKNISLLLNNQKIKKKLGFH